MALRVKILLVLGFEPSAPSAATVYWPLTVYIGRFQLDYAMDKRRSGRSSCLQIAAPACFPTLACLFTVRNAVLGRFDKIMIWSFLSFPSFLLFFRRQPTLFSAIGSHPGIMVVVGLYRKLT